MGESNVNNNITTIIIVNKNSIYSSKLKPVERKNGITKKLKKKGTKGNIENREIQIRVLVNVYPNILTTSLNKIF